MADAGPTYSPKFDVIHLPTPEYVYGSDDISPVAAFQIAGFHEIMHWTGAKRRLRRHKDWSVRIVAIEEMAAELGSAFLCRDLGVTATVSPRHAAYIARSWQKLGNDPAMLEAATEIAEAGIRYIYAEAREVGTIV